MKTWLSVSFAFVGAGAVLAGVLLGANPIAPAPLKVGVVDLTKVVDNYQKKKDREAELNKVRDASTAQLKALQKTLEGMSFEMELLDKNSPEFAAKKRTFSEKQEELLMRTRLAEREVMGRLEQYLQEVYNEILSKIADYRAANHFDFIVRVDSRPLTTQERIVDQLDRKIILASAQTFDVTADVIEFLNKSYSK